MHRLKVTSILAAAVLGLAACGGVASPSTAPATSTAAQPASAAPAGSGGEAKAASPALQKVIDGAKKESVVKGVWSETSFGGSEGFQALVAAVDKKYGVNLKAQFTPGQDMQSLMGKVAQEVAAGQPSTTDVYLGNSQSIHDGIPAKALKSIDWQSLLERPIAGEQGFDPIAPDNMAVALSTAVTGITYNSKLISANDMPHKLNDLLDPKWKGKIASTPYAAGFRDFASKDVYGKQYMIDFTTKFSKQIAGLIRCGEYDRLSSGEFQMLALDCGNDGAFVAQRQGAPISQVILDDATSLHLRYAGVPATSSAPNGATLIVLYLETPEGQAFMYKYDGMDLHTYPESHMKALVDKVRSSGGKIWSDSVQNLNAFTDYSENQKQLQDILQKGVSK